MALFLSLFFCGHFWMLLECYFFKTCINCATVTFSITTANVIQCKSSRMLQNFEPKSARRRGWVRKKKWLFHFIHISGMQRSYSVNSEQWTQRCIGLNLSIKKIIKKKEISLTLNAHIQSDSRKIVCTCVCIFVQLKCNYFVLDMRKLIVSCPVQSVGCIWTCRVWFHMGQQLLAWFEESMQFY